MKKSILFIAFFSFCTYLFAQAPGADPVLMVVDGEEITKSEFEYIYKKNSSGAMSEKDLDNYAILFADLKLKVAEAKAQGVDTTTAFKQEFQRYRTQSAKRYLIDKKLEEELIQQAYDRMKQEVNVSHILLRSKGLNTPEDTLRTYNRAIEVRKRLLNGEDFAKVAKETSDDGSAEDGGNLGYVSAFRTILAFENVMYSLPVGEISMPVYTLYGHHIIKVNDKRPFQGNVRVAHIMKIVPPGTNEEQEKLIRASIDSLYEALNAGADFSTLATQKSDHAYTVQRGGELGWFTAGRSGAGTEFEDAAFALTVGEYSRPVRSKYGYHIIMLLDKEELPSLEEKRAEITRLFQSDIRSSLPVQSFKKELRKEYNLQIIQSSVNEIKNIAKDFTHADSAFFQKVDKLNNPLFSFKTIVYYQNQFVDFLKEYRGNLLDIDLSLDYFIDSKLYEYEDARLEEKDFEFRMLMQEYYDGMMMFEISSKEVWEKAGKDTEGLKAFFEENKQNYTWEIPRFKGMLVYCKDKKTEKRAKKIIQSSPADSVAVFLYRALNTGTEKAVKVEKGLYVKGENAAVDKYVFKTENSYTPPKQFPVVFVADGSKVLTNGPEEYTDLKGVVMSDYQNYLQEEWIKELRGKYQVIVYPEVLHTIRVK